jgi:hypothetical protein
VSACSLKVMLEAAISRTRGRALNMDEDLCAIVAHQRVVRRLRGGLQAFAACPAPSACVAAFVPMSATLVFVVAGSNPCWQ